MYSSRIAISLLLGLIAYALTAQDIVIKAGHLIDPDMGTILEDQLIWISNGKIKVISDKPGTDWPKVSVDLSGSWVMPGLIDCHTHITSDLPFGNSNLATMYVSESTAFRAMRGLYNAGELLRAGFTTLKDVGNDGNYATADVIKAINKGWFDGPTIIYSGKIIAPFGGQVEGISPEAGHLWDYEYIVAETPEEMIKAIHQNIYYGANAVKIVTDQFRYYYDQKTLSAGVTEAHRLGLKITVHVMGGDAAREAIMSGIDGIDHGFYLDQELLSLMKQKNVYLIGTDFTLDHLMAGGWLDDMTAWVESKMIIQRLKMAYEMGVKMAFGSDVVVNIQGKNRVESTFAILDTWIAAGIPPVGILRCMTVNASDLLGIENERGMLLPGLYADIIATEKNPLEDIHNLSTVHFVMKNGKIMRND